MRDPLSWSIPLGQLFGITVRVHIFFPFFALAVVMRVAFDDKNYPPGLWVDAAALMGLLFASVLLHEFGHCFAARWMDGDAHEILMWPLGGLASIEVPHSPKANFLAAAGGPAVNLLLCLLCGLGLAYQSFRPPLNPLNWSNAYRPVLSNWAKGTDYGTKGTGGGTVYVRFQDDQRVDVPPTEVTKRNGRLFWKDSQTPVQEELATLAWPEVLLARVFFLNWFLLLLNLLPGFPLDGGRMFQALMWWRTDYRQATISAVMAGFIVMLIIGLFALIFNEVMPLLLAWFIWMTCRQQWIVLETGGEEQGFGYDFSQGYTSLEPDQPATPRRRRPNFFQRWLQKRAARKQAREQEVREAEERRMDELLEKVHRHGKEALTEEERRFMNRVSARYRNRN